MLQFSLDRPTWLFYELGSPIDRLELGLLEGGLVIPSLCGPICRIKVIGVSLKNG